MNKTRRAQLQDLLNEMASVRTKLEEIRDAEQEAYDALPESLQDGERGTKMAEAIDAMDSAISSCEDVDSYLSDAQGE